MNIYAPPASSVPAWLLQLANITPPNTQMVSPTVSKVSRHAKQTAGRKVTTLQLAP